MSITLKPLIRFVFHRFPNKYKGTSLFWVYLELFESSKLFLATSFRLINSILFDYGNITSKMH